MADLGRSKPEPMNAVTAAVHSMALNRATVVFRE